MMKKKGKTIGAIGIMICVFVVFSSMVSADQVPITGEPIVNIILEPQEPVIKSDIMFTATILSENTITDVRIVVQECKEGLCYLRNNESMTKINTTTYQKMIPLIKDDSTYISYYIELESNGQWYTYPAVNLTLKTNGDSQNGNITNGNGHHKTPGFEVLLFIIAVGVLIGIEIIYLVKKRLR
ncbi:MAG: hypothetical protein NT038_04665 [Euryarchaeota archaeon]|nr:hypothetical protein [Euryarchaeota archaeon]